NWGRVVFLSSESGLNIPPDMIHYGFTETAVPAIARGLAKRLAGTRVTVNSVLPGPTLTEGVEDMLKGRAENTGQSIEEAALAFVKANRPSSVIGRMAAPEEVANMVVYAVSPQASATTGAALRVDGGIVDTIASSFWCGSRSGDKMSAKKIRFLVGDFAEDYEVMVPSQARTMVGHVQWSSIQTQTDDSLYRLWPNLTEPSECIRAQYNPTDASTER